MGNSKFDPQSFFRQVESVALHVPVSEIFGLFRRTLDLPGSWAALVTKKSGDSSVVRAGGVVEAAASSGRSDIVRFALQSTPGAVERFDSAMERRQG